MNAADTLNKFLERIDNYIESKGFNLTEISEDSKRAENFSLKELDGLTKEECFNYAYSLYQTLDNVNFEHARNKSVVSWCEDSLNKIISREIENVPPIMKYEIKLAYILNENELARKINDWKLNAQSRIDFLKDKAYNIKNKADCLMEKGKRK